MTLSLKAQNNSSSLGMNNITPHSLLSPKEEWMKKERALKFKGLTLLVLTHIFWILIFFTQEERPISDETKVIPIEENHELVKIPATIFSQIPQKGQKAEVSIFQEGSDKSIRAFLRGYEEDAIGESGIKAVLEVPNHQLHLITNQKKIWKVFPPITSKVQTKRNIYEIDF